VAKLPELDHVKYVKAKGKVYAYFNTGAKKDGKPIYTRLPHPGSVGFYDSYAALKAARTKRAQPAYTISKLADDYEASREYADKAKNTRYVYRLTLDKIRLHLGDFPVNDLQREDLADVLEAKIAGVGSHNLFVAVLGTLYRFGRRAGKTDLHPTKDIGKLDTGEHAAWPEQLVEAGLEAEHARTRLAICLLYFTGQRIGDVMKMRWSDIRGDRIHVTQQKTGKSLKIPLMKELRDELARTPKRGITIITAQDGKPLSDQMVRGELKAFGRAHGYEVVPHGLRKNAVISLLEAGCTVAETAAITGQTFDLVEYYARQVDQDRLGSAAIVKLENKRGLGKQAGKLTSNGKES
jgi:integrase